MADYNELTSRWHAINRDAHQTNHEIELIDKAPDGTSPGKQERRTRLLSHLKKVEAEMTEIHDELTQLEQADKDLNARRAAAQARVTATVGGSDDFDPDPRSEPWSARTLGSGNDRGEALRAVDRSHAVPDAARERITKTIEAAAGEELSRLSRWTIATSDPVYLRAFFKLAADPTNGHREFTAEELRAFQRTQQVNRAMSLTGAAGGYLLPFQLDPTVLINDAGSANGVRQAARVVQGTSSVWHGVSSTAVTASWDAEASEVSDDTPTFAQPTIPVLTQRAFIPISFEAFEDEANVAQEVAKLLADAAEQLEAVAFATGNGTTQPRGIITALVADTTPVTSGTTDTFALADVVALQNALGARWQANASWLGTLAVTNLMRAFSLTTNGDSIVNDADARPRLLGRPVYEMSTMDSTVTALANNYILVYGSIRDAYTVVDRIGTSIELVPNLFSTANNLPSGQRGWLMHKRTGANVVNPSAAKVLNVT